MGDPPSIRLKRSISSGALRDEVLHYLIVRSGDLKGYNAAVSAYFVMALKKTPSEILNRAVAIWNERSA